MYFYNARYYDSALGRFIQADTIVPSPANPQSLNRYAYNLNNPVNFVDPSGHAPKPPTVKMGKPRNVLGIVSFAYDEALYSAGTDGSLAVTDAQQTAGKVADGYTLATGTASLVMDLLEIVIFSPFYDEIPSVIDTAIGVMANSLQGETYYGCPYPGAPSMLVLGPDSVVAIGDLGIGLTTDTVESILSGPTSGVSVIIGEMIGELPSAYSLYYDYIRFFGNEPTNFALGFYVDDQGVVHIVNLDYAPSTDEQETIHLGED